MKEAVKIFRLRAILRHLKEGKLSQTEIVQIYTYREYLEARFINER